MNKILVSIDCMTYNQEKYISEAIDSFLMQKTNFEYEILLHDDASTDGTPQIVEEYQKKYPDIIKLILQKENQYSQGIIKQMDYVINHKRAKGKYIAICEGDDYWSDPYKLQKQVDYMESHNECSLCFHAAENFRVGKGKIGVVKPYDENCISPTEDIIFGGGGFMATNSILYRKSTFLNPPDFYFDAPVGDYPIQILTSLNEYAYYIDEFMSVYRTGVEGSWSSGINSAKDKRERFINLNKQTIEMLNGFNEYSNKKYSDAVNRKILINEIEIIKYEKKLNLLKMPKYESIYDALTLKEKLKIYADCYMPNIMSKWLL